MEVIEPRARLTKEDGEGFREVLSAKEMRQRKDAAKRSSSGLIPDAGKISEILDVDIERKAKASYELQGGDSIEKNLA